MTNSEDISRLIRHRLNFKNVRILAKAVPFHFSVPDQGIDFSGWQTSVYHPRFDPVVIRSRRHGLIVASNTYISSFAYNLVAAWAYYFDGSDTWINDYSHPLAQALRMNFKKFFAEQILRRTHNLFGIAILLETLLYEEEIMYPVLATTSGNHTATSSVNSASLDELRGISQWLTGLVFNHELCHLIRREMLDFRDKLMANFPASAHHLTTVWDQYGHVAEEFECDAFAVGMGMISQDVEIDRLERYRLTILGFAFFAALHALDRSANLTAIDSPAKDEDPNLQNIRQSMSGSSYSIGTFTPLHRDRAQAVRLLVEAMAEAEGVDLYSDKGQFCIPQSITEDLEQFIPTIIEGTDIRLRGKCEMMARALHGHSVGIDYLAWRSKTYTEPEDSSLNA